MSRLLIASLFSGLTCLVVLLPQASAQVAHTSHAGTPNAGTQNAGTPNAGPQQAASDRAGPSGGKTAAQIYADARAAIDQKDYQRALDLLELASLKDPQPRFIYRRILVLETMGRVHRARQLLDRHRKSLAGQPNMGDLTALEQRLREADAPTNDDNLTVSSARDKNQSFDYIAWTSIGSGVLAAGGGIAFFMLGKSELDAVRCSGLYPDRQRQDCAGVDAPAALSRPEFDQRLDRVDRDRILGATLVAAGALAAGYGAYRLVADHSEVDQAAEDADADAETLAWTAGPRLDGGVDVQLMWRF